MLEEMTVATTDYLAKWEKFIESRQDKAFFRSVQPTSIGWKTTDLNEFNDVFLELRDYCNQIHFGWVNERWLASLHLKDINLPGGIQIIKLMQRRPNSTDPTGLDHLDFYADSEDKIKHVLSQESNLDSTEESNNPLCHWHSIRFDGSEAKLRADTVLDVCIAELHEANERIIDQIK